jgi:WXG100 family type VII secretion target
VADHVGVDPDDLHSTADWIDKSAQELADAVHAHMRAVRAFIGGDWRGSAATSHEGPWADWEDGARRLIGSFFTDVGALRATAGGFTTTDTRAAGAIGRTGSSLNLPEIR